MRIGKKDDLTLEPSERLNRETLERMEAHAADASVRRKKTRLQRMLSCAALVGAMFMLMSAGYRVFTYLAYVPGQGIVTQSTENAYTLSHAVKAGEYYIDAVSMVPVAEGERKGMWKITAITSGCPDEELPMTITAADGTAADLQHVFSMKGADRYIGYIDKAEAGSYILHWNGETCTADMELLSRSVYANYEYPMDQGVLAVIFPMADGSDKLVMDFTLDGISEDLQYWTQHSRYMFMAPVSENFVLTDTKGNTYELCEGSMRFSDVPLTEEEKTLYSYLEYNTETIFLLDRRLEAPVASIRFGTVELELSHISDTTEYTLTIPEENGTVVMPQDTFLLNSHGIRDTLLRLESSPFTNPYTGRNYHAFFVYRKDAVCTFPENVSAVSVIYALTDTSAETPYEPMRDAPLVAGMDIYDEIPVDWREQNHERYSVFTIAADGTRTVRQKTPPYDYGDKICLTPHNIRMYISGNWTIDFTTPAESK